MYTGKNIVGACGLLENDIFNFNSSLFFKRLLLFDNYYLDTIRLLEFRPLVNLIGIEQLIELLESNSLKINASLFSVTSDAQQKLWDPKRTVFPLFHYRFIYIRESEEQKKKNISLRLQDFELIEGISKPQFKKLKLTVVNNLISPIDNILDKKVISQLHQDMLFNSSHIRLSVKSCFKKSHPQLKFNDNYKLNFIQVGENVYKLETNFCASHNITEIEAHKLFLNALLAISSLNKRLVEMEEFNALSGFNEKDFPIFEKKVEFLTDSINGNTKVEKFDQLLKTLEFPAFELDLERKKLDLDQFLKVRESTECKEFRDWLLTDSVNSTQAEIYERFNSINSKISTVINSKIGKNIRFGLGVAADLFPFGGTIAGGIDSFLIDKIFKESTVATFINKNYRSIFT